MTTLVAVRIDEKDRAVLADFYPAASRPPFAPEVLARFVELEVQANDVVPYAIRRPDVPEIREAAPWDRETGRFDVSSSALARARRGG